MVRVPCPSPGELLAILCQSSLSIKFPYVLLYILIRSGPPRHLLEFWDSRSAITWCDGLWSYLVDVALRAWGGASDVGDCVAVLLARVIQTIHYDTFCVK